MNNYYNINLKKYSRVNRKKQTPGERLLWSKLRNKSTGFKFLRQRSIQKYIVDFLQPDYSLIIEIDGISHVGNKKYIYDQKRQNELESLGFSFLRFSEKQVVLRINEVMETIYYFLEYHSPNPSQEGKRCSK